MRRSKRAQGSSAASRARASGPSSSAWASSCIGLAAVFGTLVPRAGVLPGLRRRYRLHRREQPGRPGLIGAPFARPEKCHEDHGGLVGPVVPCVTSPVLDDTVPGLQVHLLPSSSSRSTSPEMTTSMSTVSVVCIPGLLRLHRLGQAGQFRCDLLERRADVEVLEESPPSPARG